MRPLLCFLVFGFAPGCAGTPCESRAPEQPAPRGAAAAASTGESTSSPESLRIALGVDGKLYVGDAPVDDASLTSVVETGSAVTIVAHEQVKVAHLVRAMNELERAGAVKVSVETSSSHAPPPPALPAEPEPAPASGAPSEEALPDVRVKNIGFHIGGGPNDDASKAPFREAIAAHFDEFRGCYSKAQQPGRGGTFGVDLRIEAEGGSPKVTQPRTAMKGQEFRGCVLKVFESVRFAKPKRGATSISYSLEFEPGAAR